MAGCTTLVAVPPATKDNEIYLLWNLDIFRPSGAILNRFRLFIADDGGYKYVAWGIPGLFSLGLMNERGLCQVANAVGVKDWGMKGIFSWDLVGSALSTCASVDEVIKLFERAERLVAPGYSAAIFLNCNTMWTDKWGKAVTIEYSRNHLEIHRVDESGVMVETNHHQYLDRRLSGSASPNEQRTISGSYARLGRAWELARKHAGEFDLETVMRFARDHGANHSLLSGFDYEIPPTGILDDSTICCHYWNVPYYLKNLEFRKTRNAMAAGETMYSFILQPKRRLIWFCKGKPCIGEYSAFNCERVLRERKRKPAVPVKRPTSKIMRRLFIRAALSLDKIFPIP